MTAPDDPTRTSGTGDAPRADAPRPDAAPDASAPRPEDTAATAPTGRRAAGRPAGSDGVRGVVPDDVEVAVVVDDRQRQRVGPGGHPVAVTHHSAAMAARSVPTTSSASSLTKTGLGLAIGVPTTTGVDSHRGKDE